MFHFYDETDSNAGKTVSGRVAVAPGRALELGLYGDYGAQDHALDSANPLWFVGADVQAHLGRLELKGEWLKARGTGETLAIYDPANRPYGLDLKVGAYLEGDLMVTPKLGLLGRAEVRDALVWLGNPNPPLMDGERLYITKNWRATVGARYVVNEHAPTPFFGLHNGEYGGILPLRDDGRMTSLLPFPPGLLRSTRMKLSKIVSLTVVVIGALGARGVHAAPPGRPAKPSAEDTADEVARLRAEVADQKQLIMQLVRVEQEHYDLLLRLIQGRASAADVPSPGAAPTLAPRIAPGAPLAPEAAAKPAPRMGALRGKVAFPGGSFKDVYVYVENVKSPPAHGHTFEIAQRDKQFVPEVAVVQRGTRVLFPNYDSVFHNVFSPTARHPFDLGSYRAGDEAKSVDMTATGVIDIFCNMHSRMHASVLVVPSPLYAHVGPDGSFVLDGVPLGARKIVVWGPHSKPAEQTVEVGAAGADVSFTLEVQPETAHNNKLGQPYGSYKD